jgi:hypothetical protein
VGGAADQWGGDWVTQPAAPANGLAVARIGPAYGQTSSVMRQTVCPQCGNAPTSLGGYLYKPGSHNEKAGT